MTHRDTHTYRETSIPVSGGDLHVGVWEPSGPVTDTIVAIHGVTASHRAWPFVVDELPGVRVIAPDLRGRGRSNTLVGVSSMTQHAADLVQLLDAFGLTDTLVAGHSMGAFVSVVLADLAPERVRRLVLVDGGLPLAVPEGMSAEEAVAHALGPAAARLCQRFGSVEEYLDFWRPHPAFRGAWTPELEDYLTYDLVRDGDAYRPSTTYETMAQDTVDFNTGTAMSGALQRLRHPAVLLTVPRGLLDETPGLYPPERVPGFLAEHPTLRHVAVDDLNHYTVVMTPEGAAPVGALLRAELAGSAS